MRRLLACALLSALVAGACGATDGAGATITFDPIDAMGRDLFELRVVGSNPGCVTCHSLQEGVTLVGPSLATVVSPVPGMSDQDYIRQSIVAPDEYVASGFSAGQMSGNWDVFLTGEQVESLVEYLLEVRSASTE